MELIIFIIIIVVVIISNSSKQNANNAKRVSNSGSAQISRPQARQTQAVPNQARVQTVPNQARRQVQPNVQNTGKSAAQLKNEIWERLSEESKAKMLNRGNSQPDAYVNDQVQKRRVENHNTTILDRAKGHSAARGEDVTLAALEAEHKHSERVAPAVHNHPEDVIPENMLGSVSDLMVKGYDGNLCFERDFLGEALDMISNFTVPSEVPDFSMPEMKN